MASRPLIPSFVSPHCRRAQPTAQRLRGFSSASIGLSLPTFPSVDLGFVVYRARRNAHGTARRDRGRAASYAGASHRLRPQRRRWQFMIHVRHQQRPWLVIVEPDMDANLLVVVTVYECPNDRALASSHVS